MNTYELFVHDSRYSVPTLHLLTLPDEHDARRAAESLLRVSPNHRGVELWCDGEQILLLGICPDRHPTETSLQSLPMAGG